jgi:hypothetical protein
MMHFMCHCEDCEVLFNGAFRGFAYTEIDLELSGPHDTYSYEGGSGSLLHLTFCKSCGMNLYSKPDLLEGMVYVFAGLMKEHYTFEPKVELFAHNRLPWVTRADSVVQSYDHNGTIERVSELLENIDQRG